MRAVRPYARALPWPLPSRAAPPAPPPSPAWARREPRLVVSERLSAVTSATRVRAATCPGWPRAP
eukprot:2221089-Prymnesium_polylepis.1